MPPAVRWEIVGGSDKGGILVREDASTKSAELGRSLYGSSVETGEEMEGVTRVAKHGAKQ